MTPQEGETPPSSVSTAPGALGEARLAPGRIFADRYRIVSPLGRGAMGEVYRADDLRLGQVVALKLLRSSRPDALGRFIEEVRLARGISHPNVCRVYDIGEAEGWHYLSMEYVDGETLGSLQRRIGKLPAEKALDIARQICAGLAAAHERGILHRDLKPSNIMLDGRGRVRILDFGLAVAAADGAVQEVAGTPAYMAPEQVAAGAVSERSDVYSLGLVLYELFTGQAAYAVRSVEERLYSASPRSRPSFGRGVDWRVTETVHACLEPNPDDRPTSALQVAASLPGSDPVAAALAEGRLPSPDMVAATATRGALHPALAWGLLAAVVAAVAFVGSRGDSLSLPPASVPKPPEVLAERARQILALAGHDRAPADEEFWFETVGSSEASRTARFVYRQSAEPLIPRNLLRVVVDSDPPVDADGMATVVVDPSGQLMRMTRLLQSPPSAPSKAPGWHTFFQEAGLAEADFVENGSDRHPLVPHDAITGWQPRDASSKTSVTAASLEGTPVHFEVTQSAETVLSRGPFVSGRTPIANALMWIAVVLAFSTTAAVARRNIRAGEGDLSGARKLALFVVVGGVVTIVLRAHHVPILEEELFLLLSASGWALVWGGFSWLAYVSFEPHVRRLWPGLLVAWTRVLTGRLRDPRVGREVLIGVLAGLALTMLVAARLQLTDRGAPEFNVIPALEALRSTRHFASRGIYAVLDGLQFALGGLYFLTLLRLILRRTWLAVAVFIVLVTPMIAGTTELGFDLLYGLAAVVVSLSVRLRVGLLADAIAISTERLLTRLPITLDVNAWYFGQSLVVLAVVVGLALLGFALARAPSGVRTSTPLASVAGS